MKICLVMGTRPNFMKIASLIAPFRYSRLVFALLLSILILGERPDLMTWLGAFIVVFSGYFIVLRERNIKNVKR